MSTRYLWSTTARVLMAAACATLSTSCGSEMLRTGRSPSYLVIQDMQGQAGGSSASATAGLLSDVQVLVDQTINGQTVKVPAFFNDNATAVIRVDLKNPTVGGTAIN